MEKLKEMISSMINEIKDMGIKDKAILKVMAKIPRHEFVIKEYKKEAYANYPLSINYNQTISQPYTVAFMLEALELRKGLKVLEIGAGSGYNAALIAEIIKPGTVYSTEIIPELVKFAIANLKRVGIKNAKIIKANRIGYEKRKPYDRIIVTAAGREIPKILLKELKVNGIMIIPVGESSNQEMLKIRKLSRGIKVENLGNFVFVPLKD